MSKLKLYEKKSKKKVVYIARRKKTTKPPAKTPTIEPPIATYDANVYVKERASVEKVLPPEGMDLFCYHMDILEMFMCHCKPEGSEALGQTLVLAMTAYLCSKGERTSFPKDMLSIVLDKASALTAEQICKLSSSNEIEKIALYSANSILSLLRTLIKENLETAV